MERKTSLPAKPVPVQVVSIHTQTIERGGYEVVGTTLGGDEVCRLTVTTPSSFLLSDLYKAIEKKTDYDLCLITNDGGILPGRNQVVTLADALTNRHNDEPTNDTAKSLPNSLRASLRKLVGSIALRAKSARQ